MASQAVWVLSHVAVSPASGCSASAQGAQPSRSGPSTATLRGSQLLPWLLLRGLWMKQWIPEAMRFRPQPPIAERGRQGSPAAQGPGPAPPHGGKDVEEALSQNKQPMRRARRRRQEQQGERNQGETVRLKTCREHTRCLNKRGSNMARKETDFGRIQNK